MKTPLEQLTDLFKQLPGIGPKQASRCVDALARRSPDFRDKFSNSLSALNKGVKRCPVTNQLFYNYLPDALLSPIAENKERYIGQLMIILSDADLKTFEKASVFKGQYFILGSLAPLVDTNIQNYLPIKQLHESIAYINKQHPLTELILALPATPEGDHTAQVLTTSLQDITSAMELSITHLGRGLSTGSEIEYADPKTLTFAFESRTK
jgi:recombination protein RecR